MQIAFAGDNAVVTITGSDMNNIGVGSILCDPQNPIRATSRFKARVVIFNIEVPITKGFPVVLHYQSLSEPAHIHRLISQLNKSNGEVLKKKPRYTKCFDHERIEHWLGTCLKRISVGYFICFTGILGGFTIIFHAIIGPKDLYKVLNYGLEMVILRKREAKVVEI